MISVKLIRLACALVALLAVLATPTVRAASTSPSSSTIQCGKWNDVSPPLGLGMSQLNAIGAASAHDIWAVGFMDSFGQTLIEHSTGGGWSMVQSNPDVIYDPMIEYYC